MRDGDMAFYQFGVLGGLQYKVLYTAGLHARTLITPLSVIAPC
jgi:hypothetical protein